MLSRMIALALVTLGVTVAVVLLSLSGRVTSFGRKAVVRIGSVLLATGFVASMVMVAPTLLVGDGRSAVDCGSTLHTLYDEESMGFFDVDDPLCENAARARMSQALGVSVLSIGAGAVAAAVLILGRKRPTKVAV